MNIDVTSTSPESAAVSRSSMSTTSSPPPTPRKTFAEVVLQAGLNALSNQDKQFDKEFKKAEERVKEMEKVNNMVQTLNSYKSSFDKDGNPIGVNKTTTDEGDFILMGPNDRAKWKEFQKEFIATGKIKDGTEDTGIGNDCMFTQRELDSVLENSRAYQSSLASLNEQQMLLTNHAASRRTSVFQQMQTLMSTVKESLQAAVR